MWDDLHRVPVELAKQALRSFRYAGSALCTRDELVKALEKLASCGEEDSQPALQQFDCAGISQNVIFRPAQVNGQPTAMKVLIYVRPKLIANRKERQDAYAVRSGMGLQSVMRLSSWSGPEWLRNCRWSTSRLVIDPQN
jgi:hypothetical protein